MITMIILETLSISVHPVKVFRLYASKMMDPRVVKCIYSKHACTCINACFALSCKQELAKQGKPRECWGSYISYTGKHADTDHDFETDTKATPCR